MKIETIGLEQYRRVDVGDTICSQGCAFEVAKIISQNDYGNDGGIYIEFEDPKGNYHYWKQGHDGGYVINRNSITIKDLYEKAKAENKENLPIVITYTCCDDWYNGYNKVVNEIDFDTNACVLITDETALEIKE